MNSIVMEITALIMENHGKIMELCFLIPVGTLKFIGQRIKSDNTLRVNGLKMPNVL